MWNSWGAWNTWAEAQVNQPPVANAGVDKTVNEGATVALSGSGTDADGTIVGYAWTQLSGPAVTIISANTANASFAAPQVSADTALAFRLTVTDNEGATGYDDITVTVQDVPAANVPPTASAGADQTVNEGDTVSLTGTGFDSDGTVTGYQWAQVSGPAVTINNANQANASFAAPDVATATNLVFELTVTDDDGATDTDQVTVTVNHVEPANQPPTVNAGIDQAVDEGDVVTLTGTANDSDGTIASYAWAQLSGPTVVINNANQAVASFTAPNVNSSTPLIFRLTATDDDGATASDTVTITINNADPVQTSTALLAISGIPDGNYLAALVDIQGGSLVYAGSVSFLGGKVSIEVSVPPGTALHYLVMDATIPPQYCSGGYVITM